MAITKVTSGLISADASSIDLNIDAGTLYLDVSENRVGIGTTSPQAELHVSNGSAGFEFKPDGISDGTSYMQVYDRVAGTYDNLRYYAAEHYFHIGNNEKVRIDSSGNVGIGETSPANLLHVKASDVGLAPIDTALMVLEKSGTNYLSFMGANTNTQGVLFGDADDNDVGQLIYNHSSNHMAFSTAATERLRIDSSGNLNLNTTGQTDAKFSVNNASGQYGIKVNDNASNGALIKFTRGATQVGTITTNGTTTAYNTSSDYRLKENVDYEFNALNRVAQLKPARFNFITDANTTVDGFLAHEVQDIVPEAVTGLKDAIDDDGTPKYQYLDVAKLVPLLTKAIQEQQTIIDNLKTRIETLENA